MYDLIGDVHGHAATLQRLLEKLDYREIDGVYRHPERSAIFLGDLIDAGPQIGETLQIVRSMVDAGTARTVLGNHEWNALLFHTARPDDPSQTLRRQTPKNRNQLARTHEQLSPEELDAALAWFRTWPLWLDLGDLRVVHACWDDAAVSDVADLLTQHGGLSLEFLYACGREGAPGFAPVEVLLKGKEMPLPPGVSFVDKHGATRTATRARWYADPDLHTLSSYSFGDAVVSDDPLPEAIRREACPYPASAPPVFLGHYFQKTRPPGRLAANVACLDYAVAGNGLLCAYRWSGESELDNSRFVWVAVDGSE